MVAGWGVIFRKFDLCTEKQSREKKIIKKPIEIIQRTIIKDGCNRYSIFQIYIHVWCVTVRAFYLPEAIFTTVAIPLKIEL